jgi:dTDP-glucose 4,6-dehydratase
MAPPVIATTDLDEVVRDADAAFESLRDARLLLTGATGFFGVWLLSALAHARRAKKLDTRVVLLSRDPGAARARLGGLVEDPRVELVSGDTRTFAFPSGTFTHVVHGATSASASLLAEQPREMLDVIVDGTRRVLEFARSSRAHRLLFLSSGAVYGQQPSELTHVAEDYIGGPRTLEPRSAYGEGKRAAELLCAIAAREGTGLEMTVARGFAFVGPHLPLDIHFAIGNFIRDALAGGPIRILGDGTPYRSYMYGTDLATWLFTLLVRGRSGAAYNVGSDDGRPLAEIAARIAAASGARVEIAKTPPPDHRPERYVPDVSLARRELGLAPRVDLDEAIRRTLKALR